MIICVFWLQYYITSVLYCKRNSNLYNFKDRIPQHALNVTVKRLHYISWFSPSCNSWIVHSSTRTMLNVNLSDECGISFTVKLSISYLWHPIWHLSSLLLYYTLHFAHLSVINAIYILPSFRIVRATILIFFQATEVPNIDIHIISILYLKFRTGGGFVF